VSEPREFPTRTFDLMACHRANLRFADGETQVSRMVSRLGIEPRTRRLRAA
jgi:hypothetical protein